MNLKTASVLFLLILVSCKIKKREEEAERPVIAEGVIGCWRLAGLEKEMPSDSAGNNVVRVKDSVLQAGYMICFFPDGTCTQFSGGGLYKQNTWQYDPRGKTSIILADSNGKKKVAVNRYYSEGEWLELDYGKGVKALYGLHSPITEKLVLNAFYSSNNLWRIKATHPQTAKEQLKRFDQFLKHLLLLLRSAQNNTQRSRIDFRFSKGAVRVYDGGIGAEKNDKLAASWKKIFYSEAEAFNLQNMLVQYFEHAEYKSKGGGTWIKIDCDILESMIADIAAGKFPLIETAAAQTVPEKRK